jgi:class 3 adenylate cyclase
MKCTRCNKENPEGADVCVKCGSRLIFICPQCATELPLSLDVRFCFKCGQQIKDLAEAEATALASSAPSSAGGIAERLQRLVPKEFADRLLATRGRVEAERRMVTILFSDVKGSTAMAGELDPED